MDEQDPVVCVEGRGHFLFSSYFQVSLVCLRLKPETNREEKKLITVKGTYTPPGHIRNHQGVFPNNRTFYNRQILF